MIIIRDGLYYVTMAAVLLALTGCASPARGVSGPEWMQRAFVRYEGERLRQARGDGFPFGQFIWPVLYVDAVGHGPISAALAWWDVFFPGPYVHDPNPPWRGPKAPGPESSVFAKR